MNTKPKLTHLLAPALTVLALALTLSTSATRRNSLLGRDGAGASGNPPTAGVGGTGTWDTFFQVVEWFLVPDVE